MSFLFYYLNFITLAIKAEVIKYANFIKYGSEIKCKEHGKLSIEGKDYVVNDGDIMHFRFNV